LPRDVKDLVRDGLVHSGLFFLLIASLFVPFIHLLVFWFLPLPFLLLRVKQSPLAMAIPVLLFGFLLGIFPHPVFAFFFLFSWIVGWAMGSVWLSRRFTGTDVVLAGWVSGTLLTLAFIWIGHAWLGLFDSLKPILIREWKQAASVLMQPGAGISAELFLRQLGMMLSLMVLLFPLLISLATFLAARRRLVSQGHAGKSLPPFEEWRVPKSFFYFFGLCYFTVLLAEAPHVRDLAGSALAPLQLLFVIQGLAFITFILKKRGMSQRWLIPAVLLALTPLAVIVLFLGLLDTATSVRKRIGSGDGQGPS
jgi:uncharacterized protein YybS (DUF2232 family)